MTEQLSSMDFKALLAGIAATYRLLAAFFVGGTGVIIWASRRYRNIQYHVEVQDCEVTAVTDPLTGQRYTK